MPDDLGEEGVVAVFYRPLLSVALDQHLDVVDEVVDEARQVGVVLLSRIYLQPGAVPRHFTALAVAVAQFSLLVSNYKQLG